MGYLLFVVAVVLMALFLPIAIVYNTFRSLFHGGDRMYYVAILIDKIGNVIFGSLFNDTMIEKGGHQFGNYKETISYVLGKNKQTNTLSRLGSFVAYLLNLIHKDHVELAVRNSENRW